MSEEVDKCSFFGCSTNFTPAWWTFVLLGILAIVVGAIAFLWTPMFILFVGMFIGIMVIIYSVMTIVQGIKSKEGAGASAALILLGILGVIIGFFVVSSLFSAWLLVTYLIAIWAFLAGFTNIWMAFSGNAGTGYKILLLIAGIIALILGFYVMVFPVMATDVVVQVFALFSMVWGVVLVITGLTTRKVPVTAEAPVA
ncbi:uncharacterized membrane protein HdeD (DUF308 family) [Methanomicrobium sp. W14]|uniref:HdeD family acid-resistance protein n=1 Tax=Methanomicrobium sp. W14 TaxID=2817839 RepID=UPI001AE54AB8|nr:DUF308 domain-containing protein [Methanomicrobium sp. W14]MBP2134117.1 uncharacterized membrane protein HdeD (DUF308 family) [Methanomicrobium sp. W14]